MASLNARYFSYRNTASSILLGYDGKVPFVQYLKTFFRKHSKYGSRDRKEIADLCYGYFRIGESAHGHELNDQLNIGYFLTHQIDNGYLEALMPEWVDEVKSSIGIKFDFIKSVFPSFNVTLLFPFKSALSNGLEPSIFNSSFLSKSSYFLRIRPGFEEAVLKKLESAKVSFKQYGKNSLEISEHKDISSILSLNEEYVVQDISSQQTATLFPELKQPILMWDACAASGGKSIMFHDYFPTAKIIVSDLRESILVELKKRFTQAAIQAESIFNVDLFSEFADVIIKKNIPSLGVDFIIADVPCSGSGTWKRDPEWLRYFNESELGFFQRRQIGIVRKILPYLKKDGYLLYITCSVFKAENEDVLSEIQRSTDLHVINSKLINGHDNGGDQLFVALLTSRS
jgi:16S rRNA (cytosine967-C5)-methyltransferase